MQLTRPRVIRASIVILLLCIVGIAIYLIPREPIYEGKRVSYWLDNLTPTIISSGHSMIHSAPLGFRNRAATDYFITNSTARHEQAWRVLESAGPECLPILLTRLTESPTSRHVFTLQRWAYTLRLSDARPVPSEDETSAQVRRGQAVTALIRLGKRASPVVPQLIELTKSSDAALSRMATYALWEIAPDEFIWLRKQPANENRK